MLRNVKRKISLHANRLNLVITTTNMTRKIRLSMARATLIVSSANGKTRRRWRGRRRHGSWALSQLPTQAHFSPGSHIHGGRSRGKGRTSHWFRRDRTRTTTTNRPRGHRLAIRLSWSLRPRLCSRGYRTRNCSTRRQHTLFRRRRLSRHRTVTTTSRYTSRASEGRDRRRIGCIKRGRRWATSSTRRLQTTGVNGSQ